MKDVLCQTELSEPIIDEALCYVEQEYQRKYCFSPKPQLYFFTPISAVDGGDSAGYDQFCQNVGGELARWSLMNKMPNVYKTLKAIGIPVIVEFELSFSDIANFQKESISYCFVTYYSAKKFWKMDCPVIFEASNFDRLFAMDREMLFRFLNDTQPDEMEALSKIYKGELYNTIASFINAEVTKARGSLLDVLKHGIEMSNIKLELMYTKPATTFNQELLAKY